MNIKQELIVFYLDWLNNYLTVEGMAEQRGLTVKEIEIILEAGRELNELQ